MSTVAALMEVNDPAALHILLVEDDPVDARVVRELLRGWAPLPGRAHMAPPTIFAHAGSLREAVGRIRGAAFDAIVLDLSLPDAEGLQAVRQIRSLAPEIPIVILSAHRDEELALSGVEAGAQDYLVKGRVDSEGLARALRYAIARKRDELERARQAVALAESEHRFRTLVEAAPVGTCITDEGGHFEAVNDAYAGLHGYVREELIGRHIGAVVPILGRGAGLATLGATEDGGQLEYEAMTRQGERRNVLMRAVRIAGSDGRPRFAAFALDVTAQMEALRQAERARAIAEDLTQLREDFIDAVSHELRTPLTAIVGFAELLYAGWPRHDEAHRLRCAERIARSAYRLQRLVEDLLLVSRMSAATLLVRSEPVPAAQAARHATDEIGASYAGQRIDLDGPDDLRALADADRIVQVLVNLLDNAAKYSPEGSPIALSWQAEGDVLCFRVRDRGPGIPEPGRARLFTRFGRVPGSRLRAGRIGTGLGLFLGRQLAQAMGGDLDLESTGPDGSVFRLRLRLVTDPGTDPVGSTG